ncbi:MAG: multiple sugar transport system substrate-binding protein [Frankiaceae bacterium]|nr:multiple sugar transport system substrate-binding protein [Frankiaceae bacterium]
MRLSKIATATAMALVLAPLAACSSSSSSSAGSTGSTSSSGGASASGATGDPMADKGQTLTYWASNQGTSLENDKAVLQPELDKFKAQTGITVNVEVVPWSDLLNRVLAATTSGQGPDVVNIGNTWSASVQATGAFLPFDDAAMAKIGGKDKFLAGSLSATGATGQPPTAVPIYSLAYGLYYNKKQFAAAGITAPPATWDEFTADAKKLTTASHWALALEGGSKTENIHSAFMLSQQQGGSFFDAAGKATFDTPQNVAAIKQYVDFMQTDKIVNPSDGQYSKGTDALKDFATGVTSMVFWQAASGSLKNFGMNDADIGVAPIPLPATMPAGGKKITSMVAGINLGVFKNTKYQDAALKFVNFMTSTDEQMILNKTYGSLPSIQSAYTDPAFQTPNVTVFKDILANSAAPMPPVPAESQFETLVGTAMTNFMAEAATGKTVTADEIHQALAAAQAQVTS